MSSRHDRLSSSSHRRGHRSGGSRHRSASDRDPTPEWMDSVILEDEMYIEDDDRYGGSRKTSSGVSATAESSSSRRTRTATNASSSSSHRRRRHDHNRQDDTEEDDFANERHGDNVYDNVFDNDSHSHRSHRRHPVSSTPTPHDADGVRSRPQLQHSHSLRRMPPNRSNSATATSAHRPAPSLQRTRSLRRRDLAGSSHQRSLPSRTKSMPLHAMSPEREARMQAMRAAYAQNGPSDAVEYGVGGRMIPQNLCDRSARSSNGGSGTVVSVGDHSLVSTASSASSMLRKQKILDDVSPIDVTGDVLQRGRPLLRSQSTRHNFASNHANAQRPRSGSRRRRRRRAPNELRPRSNSIDSADLSIDSHVTDDVSGTSIPLAEAVNPENEDEWLAMRARVQDEIINAVNRERIERERLEQQEYERQQQLRQANLDGLADGEDGLMTLLKKKNALSHVAKAFVKTAGATRSAAKGSVNVVKDPKRAAKHIGSFTKDVAKGTVNVVKDPTRAARQVGKTTVKVGKGSVNVASGVTKGVAKGTLGVTTTVVKGGFKGTTKVVGGTAHGVKKVAKGTAKLVANRGHKKHNGEVTEYDARMLEDRSTASISLYDRVAELVETSDSSGITTQTEDETVAAAAAAAAMANSAPRGRNNSRAASIQARNDASTLAGRSCIVPMIDTSADNRVGSWDL